MAIRVIITDDLKRRPSRLADYQAENCALSDAEFEEAHLVNYVKGVGY